MIAIEQSVLTDDIKKFTFDGFAAYAVKTIGFNGTGSDIIAFTAKEDEEVIGALSVLTFYGALWIKYLFIKEEYWGIEIGKQLIDRAIQFAKEQNLTFIFVETLSFQALGFYQKLGFELEFTRTGYQNGISFHYLRKDL